MANTETAGEMTFWEHLGELRVRLFRAVAYLAAAACIGWFSYPAANSLLVDPVKREFARHHISMIFLTVTGPFFLRMQVAMILGLVYAMPLLTAEMWGFIAPALMPHERKWVYFVGPLSVCFFALGITAGFLVIRPAVVWFLGYLPAEFTIMANVPDLLIFEVKCIVAFGLVFQLPVVLMFLAMVGLVTRVMLIQQWRPAVCVLTVVAAVVTPSNDPVTMLAMAVPLVILYGLSIFLVGMTEKMTGRAKSKVTSTDDHGSDSDPVNLG